MTEQAEPEPTRVELRRDGPIVVRGPVTFDDGSGPIAVERLALCRCGRSSDAPRCDGSHKGSDFRADGVVPPRKPGRP